MLTWGDLPLLIMLVVVFMELLYLYHRLNRSKCFLFFFLVIHIYSRCALIVMLKQSGG
jgi:hypothetical protein